MWGPDDARTLKRIADALEFFVEQEKKRITQEELRQANRSAQYPKPPTGGFC